VAFLDGTLREVVTTRGRGSTDDGREARSSPRREPSTYVAPPPQAWELGAVDPATLPVSLETAVTVARAAYAWELATNQYEILDKVQSSAKKHKDAVHTAQQRCLALLGELEAAAEGARVEFAGRRGWKYVGRNQFGVEALRAGRCNLGVVEANHAPVIEHSECYMPAEDSSVPAAILSHTYVTRVGTPRTKFVDEGGTRRRVEVAPVSIESFARKHGLTAEVLTFSWRFPTGVTAVVFTREVTT
jgi:hypothetical protein